MHGLMGGMHGAGRVMVLFGLLAVMRGRDAFAQHPPSPDVKFKLKLKVKLRNSFELRKTFNLNLRVLLQCN